ncbi:MAG: hypothetical protein CFE32_03120 [Alphaproteobacteria bacterium PA3]|nr:MAG: hypothetical protein CFE32_03120 [Alphaproteobacteria bacterium PA3]
MLRRHTSRRLRHQERRQTGTLALARGGPVVVLGKAVYDLPGLTFQDGLDRFWTEATAPDAATFAAFRRSAERPQARVEKRPALRSKQGMWTLFGEHGQVLKRGHDLANVLAPMERRLLKVIED